jgi:hypothetical protein
MSDKLLRVTGRKFVAGIWFKKQSGKWVIHDMAPILRKILGQPDIKQIPIILKRRGCKFEWV